MPSRLGGKPARVTNASKLVDAKSKCSSYGNALVSSQRCSWAHSLNPTQRIWLESTNLTKRGWGEPLRLRAFKNWLRSSAKSPRTAALHCRRLGGTYTPQRIKLAVSCRAAPVPHTSQNGVRKTSRWASGTGQTGAPDRFDWSSPKHPQNPFYDSNTSQKRWSGSGWVRWVC
jgi:hypothetical protein